MSDKPNEFLLTRGHLTRASNHLKQAVRSLNEVTEALQLADLPSDTYSGVVITIKNLNEFRKVIEKIRDEKFSL